MPEGHPFEGPVDADGVRLVADAEPGSSTLLFPHDPDAGACSDLAGAALAPWTGLRVPIASGAGAGAGARRPTLPYPDPFCA